MQKGFASLEIIIAVMTITILATVAVPSAVRVVDRAAVNYEQKRLYSELQFVRTLDRSATVSKAGMNGVADFISTAVTDSKPTEMQIFPSANSYQIMRGGKIVRDSYKLQNGVTFSTDVEKISFDSSGRANVTSKTILLTSRLGHEKKIVIDSVGRIRGGDDEY